MNQEQRAALVDHELCHFTRAEWEEPDPNDSSKWVTMYGPTEDPDSWGSASMMLKSFQKSLSVMAFGKRD